MIFLYAMMNAANLAVYIYNLAGMRQNGIDPANPAGV